MTLVFSLSGVLPERGCAREGDRRSHYSDGHLLLRAYRRLDRALLIECL